MDDFDDEVSDDATLITHPETNANQFKEPSTLRDVPQSAKAPLIGSTVQYFGDYELLFEIARGGMGVVYKARQVRLNRVVALKMILAGQFAGSADVQRFQSEAEAAAQLDHPGIVPIFEVGEHGGHHFFSMGFVEGNSLAHEIADGPLPPREAAEIVRRIADAVQFAHEKGVVHRDLKPANILIDRDGVPRVTDFGLAKRIEGESNLTATGQILGTPSYMPPEQAAGRIDDVQEAADVYSLGAVLYATLTGRPPFQADNPLDTLMQVLDREPVTPRSLNPKVPLDLETICLKCLEKDRHRRYQSAHHLCAELQRFLNGEPILARPISRTARLGRWFQRNPVIGLLLTAIAISLVAGTTISTWFAIQSHHAAIAERDARKDAEEKQQLAERLVIEKTALADAERIANERINRINTRLTVEKSLLQMEQGKVTEGLHSLTDALDTADDDLQNIVRSNLALWSTKTPRLQADWESKSSVTQIKTFANERRVLLTQSRDQSSAGECRVWDAILGQQIGEPIVFNDSTESTRFNAAVLMSDFQTVVVATSQGVLQRWNVDNRSPVGEPIKLKVDNSGKSVASIDYLALSPDGMTLMAASRQKRIAWLLDAITLQLIAEPLVTKGWISGVGFSSDGALALLGIGGGEGYMQSGQLMLFDSKSGEPHGDPIKHPGRVTAFDASSESIIAIGGSDGTVAIWDLSKRLPIGVPVIHDTAVNQVLLSIDGTVLATADANGSIRFFDPKTGLPIMGELPQRVPLTAMVFLDKANQLLIATTDNRIRLWTLGRGWRPEYHWQLEGPALELVVKPEESIARVAWGTTVSGSGGLRTFDMNTQDATGPALPLGEKNSHLVISHDLNWVVNWQTQTADGKPNFAQQVELLNTADGSSRTINLGKAGVMPTTPFAAAMSARMIFDAQFSPDSRYLIVAALPLMGPQGRIWICDTKTAEVIGQPLPYTHTANAVVLAENLKSLQLRFDDTGERLLGVDITGIRVWDLATGKTLFTKRRTTGFIRDVLFSPDSNSIVAATENGDVSVFEFKPGTSDPEPILKLSHPSAVTILAFSPVSHLLATACTDRVVRLWDIRTGMMHGESLPHQNRVSQICFDPKGKMLAVACNNNIILWDLSTRQRIGPAIEHPASLSLFEFSSDAKFLLSSGADHVLKWWNLSESVKGNANQERAKIESFQVVDEKQKNDWEAMQRFVKFAPQDREFSWPWLQQELNLSDEQIARRNELEMEWIRKIYQWVKEAPSIHSVVPKVEAEIKEFRQRELRLLTNSQRIRWDQFIIQKHIWLHGPGVFTSNIKQLDPMEITIDQQKSLDAFVTNWRAEHPSASQLGGFAELITHRQSGVEEAVLLLTDQQRTKWDQLVGSTIDWKNLWPNIGTTKE
ncbi:MAG: hypothetical protein CMN21_07605 [Rubinisphaera sp.]|nr:hypothetical protein [Rubinisphaera sp.]